MKLESDFFIRRFFVPRLLRKVKVIKEPPRCCDRYTHAHARVFGAYARRHKILYYIRDRFNVKHYPNCRLYPNDIYSGVYFLIKF